MAIVKVSGDFFDPEHSAMHESFGFRSSLPAGKVKGGKVRAMPPMDTGGTHPHAHPHGHADIVRTENRPDGAWVEHHAHGGQTVHHVDGLVTHHVHNGAPATSRHDDAKQDRALIMKMIKEHDAAEGEGMARGGMVRLPRGMKPKVAQSHSPILSPNNTAPRKPQVTRTPPNDMAGGVMPYGVMPSDEPGYEQTSPTGATVPGMKKGGRVRP